MKNQNSLKKYEEALNHYFNYDKLRDSQKDALSKLDKGNVLAIMPTGAGKSMIYVLPAITKGFVIVISPLISLMQDQYNKLNSSGINVGFINSSISPKKREENLKNFKSGKVRALYIAPERFSVPGFLEKFNDSDINLLAIDEAHCISEWGHDFRPDYLNLYEVRKSLKPKRTIAMTATADEVVQKDITKRLNMLHEKTLSSFNRKNLFFKNEFITSAKKQDEYILDSINNNNDGSIIIYCRTRKMVEATSEFLNEKGINSIAYHAGFDTEYRRKTLDKFMMGDVRVIVATTAFGMGIDKPDVRKVFHKGMPSRLEEYYQQAGRAGRDGKRAECILIYRTRDFTTQEGYVKNAYPDLNELKKIWLKMIELYKVGEIFKPEDLHKYFPEFGFNTESRINMAINCFRYTNLIDQIKYKLNSDNKNPDFNKKYLDDNYAGAMKKLRQMINYCETKSCLRKYILEYFGENYSCLGVECCRKNLSSNINQLFSKLEEYNNNLKKKYGIDSYLILRPRTIDEICTFQPVTKKQLIKIWGMGENNTEWFGNQIISLVQKYGDPELVKENNLGTEFDKKMKMSPEGIIKEEEYKSFEHLRNQYTEIRIEKLKSWRLLKAKEKKWPAYIIFNDSEIEEIALKDPVDEMSLRSVKGIGSFKWENYGPDILKILNEVRKNS